MFSHQKVADFTLDPAKMTDANDTLISEKTQKILNENMIRLALNVFDSNPGDIFKPVIVFLHGNSASKKIFDAQVKYFSKNYRVMAIDLLGHGDSTKISDLDNVSNDIKLALCEEFYNPLAMISEVAQLLKSRRITNAHFVGWSLGGHIAYGIAVSDPELVASITSIGSPPVRFSHEGFKKGFNEWFVNVLVQEWTNQPKHYSTEEAHGIGGHIGINNKNMVVFAKDMISSDPQMRRNLFLKLKEYDADEFSGSPLDGERFVHETNVPLCLMVGEKDAGINASYIASVSKEMRNPLSTTHVVKDAPHAVFETHSDQYYQIIDGFIKQAMQSKPMVEFKQ